ncbi:MAG: hypothetical protein ACYSUQ_08215 [Planctomycetota bacterium]|jgi:hypothetical protein
MSSYIWIERNDQGERTVERRHADGRVELLSGPPRMRKHGAEGGYWQLSTSNGVVGPGALRKAQELDAKLGVPIDYVATETRNGRTAYKAAFTSAAEKRNWLKKHKRVDFDAGFRDPAPGDFRDQFPMEEQ